MADFADIGSSREEEIKGDGIAKARREAASMPTGEPGECNYCGGYFARIVDELCGHCRDRLARARR